MWVDSKVEEIRGVGIIVPTLDLVMTVWVLTLRPLVPWKKYYEEYGLKIGKDEAYETLGGFIIEHTENIPEQGELLYIANFQIKILKVSSSKIESVHFKVLNKEE